MKTLFLTHNPHEVHLNFAKSINARIKIIPFKKYISLMKQSHFLSYFYLLILFIYSFSLRTNKDILFIDGGSSLYLTVFLKLRNKKLKTIYLDGDLMFHNLEKRNKIIKNITKLFYKKIDAIISVSEQNKIQISKFLNKPIEICPPYPKQVKPEKVKRKNYGLYIGRLDSDKKIKRILNFAIQCPYFEKFIVIGEGTLKKYVIEKTKKHEKIVYLGKTEDISKYYNECKFLVHLPDSDPHPCTTMEAAISGCYPIISKGTGTDYLFDKIFIINNPKDFNEINKKIKYILEHKNIADKLLKKSIPKIPSKEESLNKFKNKFQKLIKQIKK